MPQSAEHLAALRRARGAARPAGGDPRRPGRPGAGAGARARAEIAGDRLGAVPAVAVSGADRRRAGRAARRPGPAGRAGCPPPDADGPVRLWVDRAFTVRGSGTVVTGTLGAGAAARSATSWSSPAPASRSGSVACSPSASPAGGRRRWPGWRSTCAGCPGDRLGRGDALLTPGRFHHDRPGRRAAGRRPGRRPAGHADPARRVGGGAGPGAPARRRTPSGCGWPARCRCGWGPGAAARPGPAPRQRRGARCWTWHPRR